MDYRSIWSEVDSVLRGLSHWFRPHTNVLRKFALGFSCPLGRHGRDWTQYWHIGANIVAISNWFVRKRGLALGVKMVFAGLSGAVVLPLVAWLISTQGWRVTCLIGGVVMWAVGLPLAWFFLKPHRPEYYGLLPDGAVVPKGMTEVSRMMDQGVRYAAEVEEVEFTLRHTMHTPAYWLLMLANAIHGLAWPVMSIHCIPFLTDIGIDPVMAAGMMSVYVSVSIPFRFIGAFAADHMKKEHLRFLLGGAFMLQMLGFVTFLLNQSISMIYVWFVLYGIGMGLAFALTPIRARYFGRKALGSIQGTSMLFGMPVGVLGPIYAGWVYDATGSYITAFTLVTALLAVSVALVAFAKPPKPPAGVTDIRKIL